MKYKLKDDWPIALAKEVEAAVGRPFLWGEHDCCLFAAKCVEAMTGVDPMAEFRGIYNDQESAMAALQEKGAGTLYDTMKQKFGEPKPASQARRGDVVYGVFKNGPALGICLGAEAVFVGAEGSAQGLVREPLENLAKAFEVIDHG